MNRDHLDEIRERLRALTWGDGLTRSEILQQWPDIPEALFDLLPLNYRFPNAGSVMSYLETVLRLGPIETVAGEPPSEYGESPLLGVHFVIPREHGVGSDLDSGYTGGGSAETGTTTDGTTYGGPQENELLGTIRESAKPDDASSNE